MGLLETKNPSWRLDHGLVFLGGTNTGSLEDSALVYGRSMAMPDERATDSNWDELKLHWGKAKDARERLINTIQREQHKVGKTKK